MFTNMTPGKTFSNFGPGERKELKVMKLISEFLHYYFTIGVSLFGLYM